MLITQKDIRIAFDTLKELKLKGHHYQLHNEVEQQQPAIYKFIVQDMYRKIINNERWTLYDFACVIYLVFKNEYGVVIPIKYNALVQNFETNKTLDVFNDYLTNCELLEDYLKPIIHSNEFIKQKNVNLCICVICAIISQYQINIGVDKK
jgi:hypothetical protein